jgi:hypothetical protein
MYVEASDSTAPFHERPDAEHTETTVIARRKRKDPHCEELICETVMFAHAERGSHMSRHGSCILSAVVAVGASGSYLMNPTDKALHELGIFINATWLLKGLKTPCITSEELLSAIRGSADHVLLPPPRQRGGLPMHHVRHKQLPYCQNRRLIAQN